MKRLKIYVAGPITSPDPGVIKKNIEIARKIGEQIFRKGHMPYVPHTHFSGWDVDPFGDYDRLYEHGIEIMKNWADAMFFIAPSKGANAEKAEADKMGMKIFTDLSQIEDLSQSNNL